MKHVASIIAKGEPPEWLIQGLEHFTVGPDQPGARQRTQKVIEHMRKATDTLMRWLPLYVCVQPGFRPPKAVADVFPLLPALKRELDRAAPIKPKTGRPPDINREICAGVVLEAWKLIRGKAEPRSLKLKRLARSTGKDRAETKPAILRIGGASSTEPCIGIMGGRE
jgi:hypothetical protein